MTSKLARDQDSNAIVISDANALAAYKKAKRAKKSLDDRQRRLEERIDEIESLVHQILEGLKNDNC